MKLTLKRLEKFLEKAAFDTSGDRYEQEFSHYVQKSFPNCEVFWRFFVVPLTRRMRRYPVSIYNERDSIRFRQGVRSELIDIASSHYSIFMNLVYAHLHLEEWELCSLEDVYVHLASACDLAERVLEDWYLILLECKGERSHSLQTMSREEFLGVAGDWYDENYGDLYDHYLARGKSPPLRLPSRAHLIKEYLRNAEARKVYARRSQLVREFRNVIVHDVKLGRIVNRKGTYLIPKPAVIQDYRSWEQVYAVVGTDAVVRGEFVKPRAQAERDIVSIENAIDSLWELLIQDFCEEFFSPERNTLRKMYAIEDLLDTKYSVYVETEAQPQITPDSPVSASGISSVGSADFSELWDED